MRGCERRMNESLTYQFLSADITYTETTKDEVDTRRPGLKPADGNDQDRGVISVPNIMNIELPLLRQ